MISKNRSARGQAGFSLMELLVALVILALVMGVVGPRVIGYLSRAKSQTADVQIENIKASLDMFLLDVGRYPTAEEGLSALIEPVLAAPGWAGPYLDEDTVPADPWGNAYRFEVEGGMKAKVYSLGRDGAEGGEGEDADIGL
ncbi:type II secretion system major pseudopilin GspG [Henriciella sp.]|uniref:type II secretion system major pseudopilin GspG n=1 Tax=Henriciella sp. TaxID=1968823 RepID=UPI002631FDF7|nr:type II secretion system major pseudopilin GspG [Henriciella sp.]